MKIRIAAAAAAAVFAQPMLAQDLGTWDEGGNRALSQDEFADGFRSAGLFAEWDADGDERLGGAELAEGLYRFWDANGDSDLSVDEWDSAVDFWFGEANANLSVSAWDADGDGTISEFEFSEALAESDLLARMDGGDADGLLDQDELAAGLFDLASGDDDNIVADEDDGFWTNAFEALAPDPDVLDPPSIDPDLDIIEEGVAFKQLPIPCGDADSCTDLAQRFCSVLGYDDPVDSLAAEGQLYVVRCADEP